MRWRLTFFVTSIGILALVLIFYASQIVYSQRQKMTEHAYFCLKQASFPIDQLIKTEVYRGTALITTLHVETSGGTSILFCDEQGSLLETVKEEAIVPEEAIRRALSTHFPGASLSRLVLGWDFKRPIYEAKVSFADRSFGFVYFDARDGKRLRSILLPPS
ncbi:MAG: hypothetical protein BSOLF_2500 [Candidatus Carbobacillus altaicus]|uniref:DUF5590 domain-containing protein n=1 Tax=Candidatus Carbonibacillus altaicus TaxID=2163959 RepID=A0A2R6Y2M6_9BACL|nr:MAG: hypothetical protein BSOLF_2500 [Candidatus Carbobacillus altaicus]